MTEQLKLCPFCGGEADIMTPEADNMKCATVMCMGCYVTGKEGESIAEAVAAWNTRAAIQPTPQRCAECDCDGGECTWIASGNVTAACHDCERPYGHEHGFPDLIIPLGVWERISPNKDDSGLLCPSCICARLHKEGIKCSGAFMSGPIRSIDQDTMYALRWTENLRRTLERMEGDRND